MNEKITRRDKRGDSNVFRAIGDICDDLIERAEPKDKVARPRSSVWLKWLAPAAACLMVAIAVIVAIPILIPLQNDLPNPIEEISGEQPETSSGAQDGNELMPARLDAIFGLPTSNYTWDEGNGAMSDRMLMSELRHLMREFGRYDPVYKSQYAVKAAFAVVKAESVERFSDDWGEGQIADCGVLYDVLGDGIVMPLKIKQHLYGGCVGEEETNLLRVGGVYVLPLINAQDEDTWYIYGDLDVLFEVDDRGLIHSHSDFEQLNKYDGVKLDDLWKDIVFLYDNPLLLSWLAEYISQGFEIENAAHTLALVHPDLGWNEEDAEGFTAKIGGDGRIAIATDGFNVFRPVEGMTWEEARQAIDTIRQYVGQFRPE